MRIRGPLTTLTAAAFLIAVAVVVTSASALDAQPLRFGISPGEIELVPGPGATASGTLLVMNHTQSRVSFHVQVADMFLRPAGELDVLPPGTLEWSVAKLTRVTPAEFELDGKRAMPVRVTVTVPADVRGGRYGVIIVSPSPVLQAAPGRGTFSIVVPKLAARLLVPVRGTEVVKGAITNMLVSARPNGKGADIKVVFRNSGNVHVRVLGEVLILNASGQQVGKVQIPQALVLPSTIREFRLSWDAQSLEPGSYTIRAVMDYGTDVLVAGEIGLVVRK